MARFLAVVVLILVPVRALGRPDGGTFQAHCDREGGNGEWERWSRRMISVSSDGLDFSRIERLAAKDPATVERMLRLGLAACEPIAAEAAGLTKLRALLPELKDLLDSANVTGGLLQASDRFAPLRVQVVLATNAIDPTTDPARYLIPLLSNRDLQVRISAAMGARHFHKDSVGKALLQTVARDPDYLIRYHAAESLLVLADIYPRSIADHGQVFELIKGPYQEAPTPQDFKKFEQGARLLEGILAARVPGKCSAPTRPALIHADVVRVSDHVVAVAIDPTESSCAKEFALVLFVDSAVGFSGLISRVESRVDPTRIDLDTRSGAIVIEYSRAAATARVRGVEIGKGDNAGVVAVASDGRITTRWRGRLDVKVKRDADVVPALLDQSPALKSAVRW